MTIVPARFDSRSSCAVLGDLDELADHDLEVVRRVVARTRRHGLQPTDVAVVVGTEQVDADVEPARALVEVVGRVAREVGQLAVGADQHPVAVVAGVGGAHPQRAVRVVQVPLAAQLLDVLAHGLAPVQRALGEPDVEVRAEGLQLGLLLRELDGVRRISERGQALAVGQRGEPRIRRHDLAREVGDVAAVVAVLRHRLPERRRLDRCPEQVHLPTTVVDVELARHRRARLPRAPARGRRRPLPTACGPGAADRSGWR